MKNPLSLLIYKESGWWVAQCLEYDIAAQARTIKDVEYEFQRIFCGRLITAQELGVDPFEGVPKAPEIYHRIFKDARKTVRVEVKPMENCPINISPYMLPNEALVYEY